MSQVLRINLPDSTETESLYHSDLAGINNKALGLDQAVEGLETKSHIVGGMQGHDYRRNGRQAL